MAQAGCLLSTQPEPLHTPDLRMLPFLTLLLTFPINMVIFITLSFEDSNFGWFLIEKKLVAH